MKSIGILVALTVVIASCQEKIKTEEPDNAYLKHKIKILSNNWSDTTLEKEALQNIGHIVKRNKDLRWTDRITDHITDSTLKQLYSQARDSFMLEGLDSNKLYYWLHEMLEFEQVGLLKAEVRQPIEVVPVCITEPKQYYAGDTLKAQVFYAAKIEGGNIFEIISPTPEDPYRYLPLTLDSQYRYSFKYELVLDTAGTYVIEGIGKRQKRDNTTGTYYFKKTLKVK